MQPLHPMPEIRTPGCTLVSKDCGLIKVEGVNHVSVAQRLEKDQLIIARPAGSGCNQSMLRSAFANRRRQLGLNCVPAIAVRKLRLGQNLKENSLFIPR